MTGDKRPSHVGRQRPFAIGSLHQSSTEIKAYSSHHGCPILYGSASAASGSRRKIAPHEEDLSESIGGV